MARGDYSPLWAARQGSATLRSLGRGRLCCLGLITPLALAAAAMRSLAPRRAPGAPLHAGPARLVGLDARLGGGGGPYACGTPLAANKTELILQEYAAWKKKYLIQVDGNALCVVRPVGDVSANTKFPRDCVSEGTGYGMLLAAYLADRQTLDGLWSFSQKFLDQNGIMHWQIQTGIPNPVVGQGGATDADEDIAMALLVAAERWGEHYRALARQQIDKVWQHEIDHGGSNAVKPGDTWGTCSDIDPSYFSPAWYKVFGKVDGRANEWRQVIDAGFALMSKCNARNGGTGLTPQWTDCNCAVSPNVGKYPDSYWCDSVRVPLRMAISATWHCDERARHQTELLASFFSKQGAGTINNGYTIQGQPLHITDTENACTGKCYVVTASAALLTGTTDAARRAEFWAEAAKVPDQTQSCYFCDILRVLSMLFTAGLMPEPKVDLTAPLDPSSIPLGGPAPAPAASASQAPQPASSAPRTPSPVPAPAPASTSGKITEGASGPEPAAGPTPAAKQGPYKCGTVVAANGTAFVLQEYRAWKAKYLHKEGNLLCIVRPVGDVSANTKYPRDCVSEGTGYGMLLAAYLADRGTFDGLWAFSQKYLTTNGVMNWQIWPGQPNPIVGKGGATDADEDIAMALLVAAERWGGNYKSLALQQINRIWQHEVDNGGSAAVLPGDGWGSCQTIDPSYFSPAWYRVFGAVTGKEADWNRVIDAGFTTLAKCNARNRGTGLTPQWTDCNCAVSPNVGKYPEKYWCDSVRVPLRMAISAVWHCDKRAELQARLLANFFGKQGAATVKRGYTIQGQPFPNTDTENACSEQCFVVTAAATFAVSGTDNAQRADFFKGTVKAPGSTQSCYFCDVLRMLSLLFMAGLMPEPQVSLAGPLNPSAIPLGSTEAPAAPAAPAAPRHAAPTRPPQRSRPTQRPRAAEPAAAPAGGLVRSKTGLCLEATERKGHAGKVQMARCNASNPSQLWQHVSSKGPIKDSRGDCLDASYGVKSSGLSPVGTWQCEPDNSHQLWGFTSNAGMGLDNLGMIINHYASDDAICLRAWAGKAAGVPVKMQVCNSSDTEQQWFMYKHGASDSSRVLTKK